jgi:MFS family permease
MSEPLGVHLKRLILPVYLPMMLVSVATSAPSAAFPQYLGALGASVAAVGIVISLRGFGNLASDLPGGLVIGRFPVGAVLKIALLLSAVSSVAMAFVRSVAAVGVLVLLTGFTGSIVVTGMMTYVRVRIPADNRGRALSLVGGSVRVGAVIGPLAGGLLTDSLGFESAILLRAGCYLLAFSRNRAQSTL